MAINSTSVAGGKVTVNYAANTAQDPKTATIVLSYDGAESQEVVITQAAAGVTKQYYVKVTTAPTDWSGTYLMVCDSKKMVLSSISTTSTKYGVGTAVTITDSKIEATETLASYQVVLSPGATSGSYLMKFKGSYLYWTSGNSLATNSNNNSNTNWLLSASNGNVTIKNCKDNSRIIGWNASSPRFACYTSAQTAIQLYKLDDGNAGGETPEQPETPAAPVLTIVEKPTSDIAAEGDVVTVKYSVTNPVEGKSVTASANQTWVNEFDCSVAGEVSFIVEENAGVARTATVTLAYEGATSQTVTISQAAAQSGGNEGGAGTVLYSEDFSSLISWSTSNVGTVTVNNVVYTSAGGNMYAQNGCLKFGKSSGAQNVGVKLPTISSLSSAANVILKFKAVSSDASYTLSVTGTGCTVGTLSPSAITKHSTSINDGANTQNELQKAFDNSQVFSVDITGMTSSSVISIVASGSAKRWYIDDIEIIVN